MSIMNVQNQKLIRTLAIRKLRASKARNIVAIIAIALTATLFTTLFAIGGNVVKSMQDATMRQVGSSSHGGLKFLTQAQYDHIKESPLLKDISYNIILGIAENEGLRKSQTEIRYSEDKSAEWSFSYPTTGDMPRSGKEIACSTITLDLLGVPHELGQKVPLTFTLYGQKITEEFTLCGFWQGDGVMMAQQAWVSREYLDDLVTMPEVIDWNSPDAYAGTISADVWFSNSFNIESKMDELIAERGYAPGEINTGVNWAYMTSGAPDPTMMLVAALVILLILASGYLIIYSVFSISVAGDIKFYGLLKTIGATGKQLKRIVRGQALTLSAAGIPLGFLLGFTLGYALTPVVTEITALKGMDSVSVNPLIFVFSGLFSLITVFISCRKPGRIAAKVSPVEAVRYTEVRTGRKKEKRARKVTALSMAAANVTRNKAKLAVVVASLSLSVILLNSVVSVVNGFDMELYLENQMSTDFLISHYSVLSPMTAEDDYQGVDESVREEIKALPGLTGYADIYFSEDMSHKLTESGRSNMNEILDATEALIMEGWGTWPGTVENIAAARAGTVPLHIYGMGNLAVEAIDHNLDFEKLKSGDYVIVLEYMMGGVAENMGVNSIYLPGEKLTLTNAEGETREFEALAVAKNYPYSMSAQHSHLLDSTVIMADNIFKDFYGNTAPMTTVFNVEDENLAAAEKWLTGYIENRNPDLAYRSREYYKAEFESLRRTYMMLGGGMAFILAMIGILNFINAVFTSITSRRKELAMLQSVGMTGKQLKTMLFGEGAAYALITVLASATVGIPVSRLIVQALAGDMWFFRWNLNLTPTLAALPVLLAICAAIPLICYRFIQKTSVVERLRVE